MAIATDRETWVGRSLERVEDEALLRGEGRFMDDLEPVPHAWHAAIVRSQLAHARVTVDASAALELPGVRGVLTGDDVARLSKPFAAGIDSPAPQYAAAVGIARYVGEPLAVVVARDRYLAEDAAELVSVDYDPLEPIVDVTAAEPIHERVVPLRRRRRRARTGGRRRVHDVPGAALDRPARRVLRRRLRLERSSGPPDGLGELPGARSRCTASRPRLSASAAIGSAC